MEKNSKREQLEQRMADGREYRAMTLAASEDEKEMRVEGYAATFRQPYTLYEDAYFKLVEQIDPGAFDACDMSDVIMQYDHAGRVFARSKNGTLQVGPDTVGLKISADLAGTDIGRQLYQEIKGGYTDKMSFGFTVAEDRRETTENRETGKTEVLRTITKIKKLYDVSAVSLPANDMTSINARRYADGVIDGIKAERLERAKKKLNLLLELEE